MSYTTTAIQNDRITSFRRAQSINNKTMGKYIPCHCATKKDNCHDIFSSSCTHFITVSVTLIGFASCSNGCSCRHFDTLIRLL